MRRALSKAQEKRMCGLIRCSGLTYRAIARMFRVSESLVKRTAKRNGLTRRSWNRWTEEEDALMREHYAELGPSKMASTFFRKTHPTRDTVCKRARVLGLTDSSKYYGNDI